MTSLLILGFGNTLMGDDGAGIAVIQRLEELGLPPGVRAVEEGSDSLQIPSRWKGEKAIWLVDALIRGDRAGTLHFLDSEQILAIPQRHATVHHLSLPETLRLIRLAYPEMGSVDFSLWGIEPGHVGHGLALTPDVERAVDLLAKRLLDEARAFAVGRS